MDYDPPGSNELLINQVIAGLSCILMFFLGSASKLRKSLDWWIKSVLADIICFLRITAILNLLERAGNYFARIRFVSDGTFKSWSASIMSTIQIFPFELHIDYDGGNLYSRSSSGLIHVIIHRTACKIQLLAREFRVLFA